MVPVLLRLMPARAAASPSIRNGTHWKPLPPNPGLSAPMNWQPPCPVIRTAPRPWFGLSRTACWCRRPWKAQGFWIFNPASPSSFAPCRAVERFSMNGSSPFSLAAQPMWPASICSTPLPRRSLICASLPPSGQTKPPTGAMRENLARPPCVVLRWKPVRRFFHQLLSGKNKARLTCGR